MNQLLDDLIKVMTLERLEMNLFRGESRDIGSPQVFGGQVLGQALVAATATAEDRVVHSLHAYFLRRGDFNSPIVYEVDRALDGKHFSSRRVVAIQHGRQIFNMSASFQSAETGLEHQIPDAGGAAARIAARPGVSLSRHGGQTAAGAAADSGTEAPVRISPGAAARSAAPRTNPRRSNTSGSAPSTSCPTTRRCIAACSPTCRISICSTRRSSRTASP